jgi:hypothetical protein
MAKKPEMTFGSNAFLGLSFIWKADGTAVVNIYNLRGMHVGNVIVNRRTPGKEAKMNKLPILSVSLFDSRSCLRIPCALR